MEDLMKKIIEQEELIKRSMWKNAKMILDKSIIGMNTTEAIADNEIIIPILHLQIAIELFIKHYVCSVYGFEMILTKKYKKMRYEQAQQYIYDIENNEIKTLGFNDLKDFLAEKQDYFGYVIKEGKSYLFQNEYDYLEGVFDEFQQIRNSFVHLGTDLKEKEKKWLEDDFFTMIIYFISVVLRKEYYFKKEHNIGEDEPNYLYLFNTSIDILKKFISEEANKALLNNKCFEENICSLAEDISQIQESVTCRKCGKATLALDIKGTDGISKCLYCGDTFRSDVYADCNACGYDNTVIYDYLNIKINGNVMQAYCYRCETKLKVYECPICRDTYSYNNQHPIKLFNSKCCEENFVDRKCLGYD